jgi:hypothetical protein
MRKSITSLSASATLAALALFGTAFSRVVNTPRRVNFSAPKARPAVVPFSSTRQDRRNSRTQIMMQGPNGHWTMQTLPAALRRTEREIDIRLAGSN